jgi:electron transfer flavoprotein beta subunit
VLVTHEGRLEPLMVASLLAALVAREAPGLVLMGKQAIDDDASQTGQMLAGLLGWPQASFASQLTIEGERAEVVREVDGGLETVRLTLPAVVTTDLRLNEPRYATLPAVMKAKAKPLATLAAAELGVDLRPRLEIVGTRAPARREAGRRVGSVDELAELLRARLSAK